MSIHEADVGVCVHSAATETRTVIKYTCPPPQMEDPELTTDDKDGFYVCEN